MRALFVMLAVLTAAAVFSGYEIVAAVKVKKQDSEYSKLEGLQFDSR
jgi:hypothetical protein